jgi:hypothetical protein
MFEYLRPWSYLSLFFAPFFSFLFLFFNSSMPLHCKRFGEERYQNKNNGAFILIDHMSGWVQGYSRKRKIWFEGVENLEKVDASIQCRFSVTRYNEARN